MQLALQSGCDAVLKCMSPAQLVIAHLHFTTALGAFALVSIQAQLQDPLLATCVSHAADTAEDIWLRCALQ